MEIISPLANRASSMQYPLAFFGKMKHYSVESMDELLASVGHLRPYLRVYDEKESVLFNSRSRG